MKNTNKIFNKFGFITLILAVAMFTMSMVACSSGNINLLRDAIAAAEDIDSDGFTEASFAELQEALADAIDVYENGGSAARIREVTLRLNRVRNDLVSQNDFSELRYLLDRELDTTQFSSASFAALERALSNGRTVYANTSARQGQIDAVVREIRRAEENLVFVGSPERTELSNLLRELNALDPQVYTSRSFNVLLEELGRAQEIYDDINSSRTFLTVVLAELNDIKTALVPRGDTTALSQAITSVNSTYLLGLPAGRNPLNFYTPVTLNAFNTVFDQAQAMVASGDNSQQEIDNMRSSLLSAAANLAEWEGTVTLLGLLESAETYFAVESRYTSATMIVLRGAVGRAEVLIESGNYTAAQIIALEDEVSAAIDGLTRITIVANGNDRHSLRNSEIVLGQMVVTLRQYFVASNRPMYMAHLRSIPEFRSETTVSGNTVITLSNGIQVTIGNEIFQARSATAVTANHDIVSVKGIDFSMDRYDVFDTIGAPTFYETFEQNGQSFGRFRYVDQTEGIQIVFEYSQSNNRIVSMAIVQA